MRPAPGPPLAAAGDQALMEMLVAQVFRQRDVHHAADRGLSDHDHEPRDPIIGHS